MQASGSVSPRMQLLRERAAIHGSMSHVRLKLLIILFAWYILQRNVSLCYSELVGPLDEVGNSVVFIEISLWKLLDVLYEVSLQYFPRAPSVGILGVVIMTSPFFICLIHDTGIELLDIKQSEISNTLLVLLSLLQGSFRKISPVMKYVFS